MDKAPKKTKLILSNDSRTHLKYLSDHPNTFSSDKLAVTEALVYIEYLEKEVRSYQRAMENISEALNSGDGTYKP